MQTVIDDSPASRSSRARSPRSRRRAQRRARRHRRPARPVPRAGGRPPVTAAELAERTDTHERYVREWLNAQAAGGIVAYEPDGDTYTLPPELAGLLADEESPSSLAGHFQSAAAAIETRERIAECFRTGDGLGWGEHSSHAVLRHGARVHDRVPARSDRCVAPRAGRRRRRASRRGARVADVGCGHGASTVPMAEAFPASTLRRATTTHAGSIEIARSRAAEAGVGRPRHVRGRGRPGARGQRLRPRRLLRRAARHGRSRRGGASAPAPCSPPAAPAWSSSRSPRTGSRTTSPRSDA